MGWHGCGRQVVPHRDPMSTDKKGTKILARTFFNQLRSGGYTPNQIIDIATELIDLVDHRPQGGGKPAAAGRRRRTARRLSTADRS